MSALLSLLNIFCVMTQIVLNKHTLSVIILEWHYIPNCFMDLITSLNTTEGLNKYQYSLQKGWSIIQDYSHTIFIDSMGMLLHHYCLELAFNLDCIQRGWHLLIHMHQIVEFIDWITTITKYTHFWNCMDDLSIYRHVLSNTSLWVMIQLSFQEYTRQFATWPHFDLDPDFWFCLVGIFNVLYLGHIFV